MRRSLLVLWLLTLPVLAGTARRPPVDVQAMQEAMSASQEPLEHYSSAASYAHFLQARLRYHEGDHRGTVDELRLALASDDGNPFLQTELAEQFARLSELDRAEAVLKKVLEKSPDYAPAQLLMGRVLFEGQKFTRSKVHLNKAIKLRPREADAYLVLTQLWLDTGRVDDAIKVVEDLSTALPGEPVGYRRLGLALAERGEAAKAEKLLGKAVERDPGDFDAWLSLAQIYESSARFDQAEEAYGRSLERDPENRDVLLAAGRLALRQDSITRAKAYFDQLLSISKDPELAVKVAFSYLAVRQLHAAVDVLEQARQDSSEPRIHFYAGLVHERMHSHAKAALAFDAVGKEAGDLYFEARVHRGMCLSALGQHKGALEVFKQVLTDRPETPGAIAPYARALERAGQVKDAEALLGRALNDKPTPEVFEAMSGLYERQGRLADAVGFLSQALQKRPKDEQLLFTLGTVYQRKGEVQKSLEKMRAVLDVNPDNANALNFIGYVLADKGLDFDEAERLLNRALELKPDNGAYLDSLGWVYFRKGDLTRALDLLERATALAPGEATINEHLGDAYRKLSRREEALGAYKRALEAIKENPDLNDARAQRLALERKLHELSAEAAR